MAAGERIVVQDGALVSGHRLGELLGPHGLADAGDGEQGCVDQGAFDGGLQDAGAGLDVEDVLELRAGQRS